MKQYKKKEKKMYISKVLQGDYRLVDTIHLLQVGNNDVSFEIRDNTEDVVVIRMLFVSDKENAAKRIEPEYPDNRLTILKFISYDYVGVSSTDISTIAHVDKDEKDYFMSFRIDTRDVGRRDILLNFYVKAELSSLNNNGTE